MTKPPEWKLQVLLSQFYREKVQGLVKSLKLRLTERPQRPVPPAVAKAVARVDGKIGLVKAAFEPLKLGFDEREQNYRWRCDRAFLNGFDRMNLVMAETYQPLQRVGLLWIGAYHVTAQAAWSMTRLLDEQARLAVPERERLIAQTIHRQLRGAEACLFEQLFAVAEPEDWAFYAQMRRDLLATPAFDDLRATEETWRRAAGALHH